MDGGVDPEVEILAHAPPGALVVGASLSPDGRYIAGVTLMPTASHDLMDDVLQRTTRGWELHSGGSGGGSWTRLDDDPDDDEGRGVYRMAEEAPKSAAAAVIEHLGEEHRVPVRHGHFAFIAWNTPCVEPTVVRFE